MQIDEKDDTFNRYNSFPVKVECLEIGWIIQKDKSEIQDENIEIQCKHRVEKCCLWIFKSFRKKSSNDGLRFMKQLHES